MDPFAAKPSLILFCDIFEPSTGQPYARDPRSTAKKAEAYVQSSGIGDTVMVGAEAEFFVFDRHPLRHRPELRQHTRSTASRDPAPTCASTPRATWATAPAVKGGYFPVPPVDSESDLRAEMLSSMGEMGLHHREAPPRGGAEPARARHQVRHAAEDGRPDADL